MWMRLLAAISMVVLAVVVLALPLSSLGIQLRYETPVANRGVELRDGVVRWGVDPPETGIPNPRDHYVVQMNPTAFDGASPTGGVRLIAVMIPAATLVVIALAWPRGVCRRRRRRGACLACGYDRRASGEARCPECGLLQDEARTRAIRPIGPTLRDAGVGLFATVLILCIGAYVAVRMDRHAQAVQQASILDYSLYLEHCRPHLTGEVAFAVPGIGPDDIVRVLRRAKPGTTVVLLPGRHRLSGRAPARLGSPSLEAKEVWLVGCGTEETFLEMGQASAQGLRIENLTIDCSNAPFLDLRGGGTLHLRNCAVMDYNSGAGDSNSVFGDGTMLLIEGCTFEGKSGRQHGQGSFGNAFDLRGEDVAFLRDTRFVDNSELWRSVPGVLDRCSFTTPGGGPSWPPTGLPLYLRDWSAPERAAVTGGIAFTEALDDPANLGRAPAGRFLPLTLWTDHVARDAAGTLGLDGDGGRQFWRRLLSHPDPAVRTLAIAHDNPPPLPGPAMTIDAAIVALSTSPASKDVVFALLLSDPAKVRPALETLRDGTGPELPRNNARMILQLMTTQPTLPELVRFEGLPPG